MSVQAFDKYQASLDKLHVRWAESLRQAVEVFKATGELTRFQATVLAVAEIIAEPIMPGHSLKVVPEPTDDEIYNRPGVEGGIAYATNDAPGSLGENDWRL